MKTVLLILLGFLLHKAVYEVIEYNNTVNFVKCLESKPIGHRACDYLLEHNKTQSILLYQPNLWCKNVPLFCKEVK